MVKCYKCAKEFSNVHICLKRENQKYFEEDFENLDREGRKSIVIDSGVLNENEIVKHMQLHTEAAEKYGYSLVNTTKTRTGQFYRLILTYEKKETNLRIIIDFSSLKDVLSKGGVVLSAYNCSKCNAMVDLPETGKILICRYCGTAIKPVDIFDKIKLLIQG